MKVKFILVVFLMLCMVLTSCGNDAGPAQDPSVPAQSAATESTDTHSTNDTQSETAEGELYPEQDIELLEAFFDEWNGEKDFSELLVYRDKSGDVDAKNLKAGNWKITELPQFEFVKSIDEYSIVGEYTDKDSNTWGHLTRTRDANASGTIKALYLDPDTTSVYFLKLNLTVDEKKYDEYITSDDASPIVFMPETTYTIVVITTVDDSRLIYTVHGGDYVAMEKMGLSIPDADMEKWLEREAEIQESWE